METGRIVAIFLSCLLAGMFREWWIGFQKKQEGKPVNLRKNRKGVYVPWGPVEKLRFAGNAYLIFAFVFSVAMTVIMINGPKWFPLSSPPVENRDAIPGEGPPRLPPRTFTPSH